MLTIKEVTKQTGITVRTMRYYDQIDLLPPAGKTEGGHRLYGEKELKKLQEIQFLKSLGFTLEEIKEMLADTEHDWFTGLKKQLGYVRNEKKRIIEMEKTIQGLLNEVMLNGKIDLPSVQKLIQLYQQNADKKEVYREEMFDDNDQELLDMLPNMNSGDPDTLEWIALLGRLKKEMSKGPSSPEIQRIVKRMLEKEQETYGNETDFGEKVWEIRKSPEKSERAGFYPIEPEVTEFLEVAFHIFMENEKGQEEEK
ncbi:MerR family transcriptional regulator [Gracilibacillus marinus]|uniref:MerR family transcriptional regulator n=1 Tax=Gracilibacillus marinus TaxID=630535 RepID=A0ABV8VXR2_9BACI